MRFLTLVSALICSTLFLNSLAFAFETDQFNLPKVPLADIGDEVSEHSVESLRVAVDSLNAAISRSEKCLGAKIKGCDLEDKEKAKLVFLRSNEAIAEAFYKVVAGGNLMTTKFGKWLNSHEFRSQPARYKAPCSESIYILNPINYATLSATVHLYGHEFGVDKLEHFFQQGYQYYKIYIDAVKKGSTAEEATQKAIKWGQKTERTYYGILSSGVYSNADLLSNYIGLKFYLSMTVPFTVSGTTRPAVVNLLEGYWQINVETVNENILKPFLDDHLNEALNPSSFRATLVGSVRRSVTKYACPEWRALYPNVTAAEIKERTESLETWNAEDYGFTKRTRTVNLAETCFEQSPSPTKAFYSPGNSLTD